MRITIMAPGSRGDVQPFVPYGPPDGTALTLLGLVRRTRRSSSGWEGHAVRGSGLLDQVYDRGGSLVSGARSAEHASAPR
jgi:hypothetical protein